MRNPVWLGLVLFLFLVSWALAQVHPFGDPRNAPSQSRSALLEGATIPLQARAILQSKCADCHSNATHWPIYSQVAPLSWFIEHDVTEGRRHMNLSQWQSLPLDRQQRLANEIVHEVRKDEMPPIQYRLVHWRYGLTSADKATFIASLADEPTVNDVAGPSDPIRGRELFEHKCTGCHAIDQNREGPHLRGVYGRRAGSVSDFEYSPALRNSGLLWKEDTLDRWLHDTDAAVPDSAMGFSVPKAQDRADLIAFLKTLQ